MDSRSAALLETAGEPLRGAAGGPPRRSGGVKPLQLTLNLIASGLGTGMFSLPRAMAGCSVVVGVLLTFAVVAVNGLTIMILVWAAEAHQVFDLGALLALLPGRCLPRLGRRSPALGALAQGFVNVMVWVVLFSSLISYLIVMHDSTLPFVGGTRLGSGRAPLITLSAAIVLALCFLDQRHLSWSSSVAVLVNIYLVVVLVVDLATQGVDHSHPRSVCLLGVGRGAFSMLAVLAQCIIIQMCALPMYEALEGRTPRRFARCLMSAFGALACIFSAFAALGYLAFGPAVDGNVLVSFGVGPLADVAQFGTVLVVAAIFPLMVIPMVAPVRHMQLPEALDSRRALLVKCTVVGIVLVSWLGALLIHNLLIINIIDGALCVGVFTALAPGLVGLHLLGRSSRWWKALMAALFLFGALNMVLGIVMSDPFVADLQAHCAWAA